MNIRIAAPVHDWRDYLPLAKEETSRFYRKQERGKFRYEDLLGVAVEALGNAAQAFDHTRNNGLAAYARKGIWGALNDYVRDACKIVSNVEMSEEEYLRTRGSPNPPPAVIRRVCVTKEAGAWHLLPYVRQTFYTPGPYRTNYQLLQGIYKVNSKHGKVSVAIGRSSYNDGWNQTIGGGWIPAKIADEPDNKNNHVPLSARLVERGAVDQSDYVGRGRQKRWSVSWLNAGVVHMALPEGGYTWQGLRWRFPSVLPREKPKSDPGFPYNLILGVHPSFYHPSQPRNWSHVIGCCDVTEWNHQDASGYAEALEAVDHDRRTSIVYVPRPVPKDRLGHWRGRLAREGRMLLMARGPSWQRDAGYFDVAWEQLDWPRYPVNWCDNWLRNYLDRWEIRREKGHFWRYVLKSAQGESSSTKNFYL